MKIQHKLFLILFGFSFLLVTSLVSLMQWSIDKGMIEYVNTKEVEILQPVVAMLAQEYSQKSNWDNMHGQHDKFRRFISDTSNSNELSFKHFKPPPRHLAQEPHRADKSRPPHKNRPPRDGRPPPPRDGDAHYALLDINENLVVGNYPTTFEFNKTQILVNEQIVGYFAISKRNKLTQGYEVEFINQQQNYLWIIALSSLLFVALITLPLAQHLVKPIKLITQGMHALTQGNYQQAINLKRKDELGQLSRDYNELAVTLAQNEASRKRWLANISHELRTPVAILRGELEAMLDDVRPLVKNNVASANDEVKHLQRLIDDLHQLTSAEIGAMNCYKEQQDLVSLLNAELDKYHSYLADADIRLTTSITVQEVPFNCDKTRLCQLFENIINNSVKYSKSTELNISLTIEETLGDAKVAIIFEDNGIGVDEEHLPNLFEHLYRVDDSRNRKDGGAGLGLSICRQIVHAHQGEIYAKQASLGGLAIIIKLPVS